METHYVTFFFFFYIVFQVIRNRGILQNCEGNTWHFYSSHEVHKESHDMVQSVWMEEETKILLVITEDFF